MSRFSVGDNVKIVAGPYQGDEGMVLSSEDGRVYVDIGAITVSCLESDISFDIDKLETPDKSFSREIDALEEWATDSLMPKMKAAGYKEVSMEVGADGVSIVSLKDKV